MTPPDVLRTLYPELTPNQEAFIPVSEKHSIYTASYGNPKGIPVIATHGGPGSGTQPWFARYFHPDLWHVILVDQRGAGKSLPKGELDENTTQHLIADLEAVRAFYGISQWAVFGGSWGSTLSLLYAEAHPERVLGLFLRGIFLCRDDDITAFVRDDSEAARKYPAEWSLFKQKLSALLERAGLTELSVEKDKIYHICHELYQNATPEIGREAAGLIACWEKRCSYLVVNEDELDWGGSADGINMGATEAWYFEHHCFIRHNQILEDIYRLRGIPVYIVQGAQDLVCPPYMADELEAALRALDPDNTTRYDAHAGHSQKETEIVHYLVQCTDALAKRLSRSISASIPGIVSPPRGLMSGKKPHAADEETSVSYSYNL